MLRDLTTKSFSVLFSAVPRCMRTIGVGRAVVQHVDGLAFVRLADALVNPLLLPAREHFRLVLAAGSPSWGSRSWAGSAWISGRAALPNSPQLVSGSQKSRVLSLHYRERGKASLLSAARWLASLTDVSQITRKHAQLCVSSASKLENHWQEKTWILMQACNENVFGCC